MSDDILRDLERATIADPKDASVKDRLLRTRVRAGLGWYGERLPDASCGCTLQVSDEQNVYQLKIHKSDHNPMRLEFVYVEGGLMKCPICNGDGFHRYRGGDSSGTAPCELCFGTGRHKLDPFYIGRFPIMWRDWFGFAGCPIPPPFPDYVAWTEILERHPVFNVSSVDSSKFCDWAGGRLPTDIEWMWAAFGGKCDCGCPGVDHRGAFGGKAPGPECSRCSCTRFKQQPYPWGSKVPGPMLANVIGCSNEDCHDGAELDSNGDLAGGCGWCHGRASEPAESTAPVVDLRCDRWPICCSDHIGVKGDRSGHAPRLVPARFGGASWCGAHDMVGQVYEWLVGEPSVGGAPSQSGFVGGFGYRGRDDAFRTHMVQEAYDDHGFRIALSAKS